MPLFGRKPKAHRAVVHQLGEEGEAQAPSYFVLCDCGWNSPLLPPLTREEAFAAAYGHDTNVAAEVELVLDEGGWVVCSPPRVPDSARGGRRIDSRRTALRHMKRPDGAFRQSFRQPLLLALSAIVRYEGAREHPVGEPSPSARSEAPPEVLAEPPHPPRPLGSGEL